MTTKMYIVTPSFQFAKDLKYFVKKKKFIKLKRNIEEFKNELEKGNLSGVVIANILEEEQIKKVRMANTTINVGQSNGFRIIYHVDNKDKKILLMTIYYKKEKNMTNDEIIKLVNKYFKTN